MENKKIGYLIIGISALIGFIVYLFNRALKEIVNTSCSHGSACPMWQTISFQTNVGLGIMAFVILTGLYIIFFMKDSNPEINYSAKKALNGDEKAVYDCIVEAEGTIFQADLAEKTGFDKVKVTRILDKLEGKGMTERKRRGMSNVVILKR